MSTPATVIYYESKNPAVKAAEDTIIIFPSIAVNLLSQYCSCLYPLAEEPISKLEALGFDCKKVDTIFYSAKKRTSVKDSHDHIGRKPPPTPGMKSTATSHSHQANSTENNAAIMIFELIRIVDEHKRSFAYLESTRTFINTYLFFGIGIPSVGTIGFFALLFFGFMPPVMPILFGAAAYFLVLGTAVTIAKQVRHPITKAIQKDLDHLTDFKNNEVYKKCIDLRGFTLKSKEEGLPEDPQDTLRKHTFT